MTTEPLIRLKDISFSYGGEQTLAHLSLDIVDSEFVAVIGPSGCGKSTLLRLVSGLLMPSSGELLIGGRRVTGPGLDRAMVFQDYSLFPWYTCAENIGLALEQAKPSLSAAERRHLSEEYLAMVDLAGHADKLPGELSGGMRQRAAIARAIATNAPLLLMDEPFGALDAITRARQQDMLLQIWQSGGEQRKTVLFVTHDVDEALLLASRVLVLGVRPGHLAADIAIDLPRPRSRANALASERFHHLRTRLLHELDMAIARQLEALQEQQEGAGI
ncbi:MAG: ABC transporter ATP-binding protein [Oligosphaeraceae bacterium]